MRLDCPRRDLSSCSPVHRRRLFLPAGGAGCPRVQEGGTRASKGVSGTDSQLGQEDPDREQVSECRARVSPPRTRLHVRRWAALEGPGTERAGHCVGGAPVPRAPCPALAPGAPRACLPITRGSPFLASARFTAQESGRQTTDFLRGTLFNFRLSLGSCLPSTPESVQHRSAALSYNP